MSSSRPHPICAAIVGAGYIADLHTRAIRQAGGVELASICGASLRSAKSFAAQRGISNVFDSLGSGLRDKRRTVLVPPDQHHSLGKTTLQFGVKVLLENSMCTSVEEADKLLVLARDSGSHRGVSP
jgi:predicted dehydrogenase